MTVGRHKHTKMKHQEEFTAYLQTRGLVSRTIKSYSRCVQLFMTWNKKDVLNCTKKEVINYLSYLKKHTSYQDVTRLYHYTAINHYFTALVRANIIFHNPCGLIKIRGTNRQKLYRIYTPDELTELADNFYSVWVTQTDFKSNISELQKQRAFLSRYRNYVMLTFLAYQGLTTNELPLISIGDIDLVKASVRIKSKNGLERTLYLKATQIGCLINYMNNIRPQFLEACGSTDQLFFSLSSSQYDKTFFAPLRKIAQQVKSIDTNFISFNQIRASVITHWIQTEGLRKAQYLAGHKSIVSTEEYLPNDLNSLTNDIQKFNPF